MKIRFYATLKPLRGCMHGPASEYWPWWKLVGFLICSAGVRPPSTGYRLWIYFRRFGGIHFDIVFDRRKLDAGL